MCTDEKQVIHISLGEKIWIEVASINKVSQTWRCGLGSNAGWNCRGAPWGGPPAVPPTGSNAGRPPGGRGT